MNKNILMKLGLITTFVGLTTLEAAITGEKGGISKTLQEILINGKVVVMLGFFIGALYGAYNLFIKDDKNAINWFLLVFGAAGIGAYDNIATQIVGFLATYSK